MGLGYRCPYPESWGLTPRNEVYFPLGLNTSQIILVAKASLESTSQRPGSCQQSDGENVPRISLCNGSRATMTRGLYVAAALSCVKGNTFLRVIQEQIQEQIEVGSS